MTDKELDLYKRLQHLFAEKMGPLQVGDFLYDHLSGGRIGYISGFPADEERINILYPSGEVSMHISRKYLLRLPLPIDPRNPGRGLVGMLRPNTLIYLKPVFNSYIVTKEDIRLEKREVDNDNFETPSFHIGEWGCKIKGYAEPFIANTPELALLKALAAQKGVGV